jgi:hypothetical protein
VVRVDKDELLRRTIKESQPVDVVVDLSAYAGKTVEIELFNEATGWYREFAHWSKIAIDSQ